MTQYLAVGGLESLIVEMCRNTDPQRFDRSVLCLNDCSAEYREELESVGVHVDIVARDGDSQFAHIRRLANHLRERRVDIVHGHSGCRLQAIVSARLARAHGAVYTAHGHPLAQNWKTRLEDHVAIALVSRMIGVSRELVDDMRRRMPEGRKRIELIVNGVDTERFVPPADDGAIARARARYGLPESGLCIGSVGRMTPVKNQAALIRALAMAVREHGTDAHLVMVGDGELEADLKRQAAAERMMERVHFLGSTRDVPAVLLALDVFALSSWTEGTSMALLEAMSAEVVPVVSDVGGNPDVVTNGEDGFMHPSDAETDFATSFTRLATDPVLLRAMKSGARVTVKSRFSLRSMMENYQSLYEQLLPRGNQ